MKSLSAQGKAHIALGLVALIYGANYSISKSLMPIPFPPAGFILIRVVGGIFLFGLLQWKWGLQLPERKDLPRLVFCGITGVALNQLFFFWGLNKTSPIHASLIMVTTPILVLAFSALFLKSGVIRSQWLGILLGALGALLIIFKKEAFSEAQATTLGNLYIWINAASFALYLVFVKPLMQKYRPDTLAFYAFIAGSCMVIPAGWNEFNSISWAGLHGWHWMGLAYVVLLTTFAAYALNMYALMTVSPATVGAYIYLQPLIAGFIAISAGQDQMSGLKIFAAILIFSGVYLSGRKPAST